MHPVVNLSGTGSGSEAPHGSLKDDSKAARTIKTQNPQVKRRARGKRKQRLVAFLLVMQEASHEHAVRL